MQISSPGPAAREAASAAGGWRAPEWVIAGCYFLLVACWITWSDHLGSLMFGTGQALTRYQSVKGLAFAALSAIALYLLLRSRQQALPGTQAPPSRWSIRLLLAGLAAAVALPLVGAAAYGVHRISESRLDSELAGVGRLSDALARATGARLAGHAGLLQLLAAQPGLRALDPARCGGLLASVAAAQGPQAAAHTLDARGRVVCQAGSRLGPAEVEPAGGGADGLALGKPRRGADGVWRIALGLPLAQRDGQPAGSVQLLLPLTALRPPIAGTLPDQGLAAIVDADGSIVARSRDEAGFVGRRIETALLQHFVQERSGALRGVGPDGVERVYGFRPVPGTPWIAVAGIPAELVVQDVRDQFGALALGLAVAALVACWLAWVVGRRIGDPVRALRGVADQLAAGGLDARASESGPSELAAVGAAFNRLIDQAVSVLRALREREARYRELVHNAPDGIAVHMDGELAYANPRLLQMLGWSEATPLRQADLLAMVQDDGRTALARRLHQAATGEMAAGGLPVQLRRPDGQIIELEHSFSSVRQNGRLVVQSHFLDVTERNRARLALERANQTLEARVAERTEQLREANEALESFSYSVAHDLRAPVSRMAGFAEALHAACGDGRLERVPHYAQRIVANAGTMDTMIDGLLQLSRAGRQTLQLQPVDSQQLVAGVVADLELPATLQLVLPPLPPVLGDAATLRQVWSNLLSNAAKFCARQEQPRIEVRCQPAGEGMLRFSVRDNGAGFDPAEAQQLFRPFQRLASASSYQGNGVGLAIVQRIVERHGGQITAQGEPGRGAEFSFTLKAAPPAA